MTAPRPIDHEEDGSWDHRDHGRRIRLLEAQYAEILHRLDGLDALRNQFVGAVAILKFMGWSGTITAIAYFVRFLAQQLKGGG